MPELRILDDALWNAVKARQEQAAREMTRDAAGNALNRVHRRKFLLSGLLHCGCCGAPYTVMAQDRYGCAGRLNRGTCTNTNTVSRAEIEARVWRTLRERMMAPGLVAEFARTFEAETRQAATERREKSRAAVRELATLRCEIDRLVDAIAQGTFSPTLRDRLEMLERRRAELEAQMPEEAEPTTVALPPRLDLLYARKLAELEGLVADPELSPAAMEAVRGLISRIDLALREGGGVAATVYGDLAEMIALASGDGHKNKDPRRGAHGGRLSVVAGPATSVICQARDAL